MVKTVLKSVQMIRNDKSYCYLLSFLLFGAVSHCYLKTKCCPYSVPRVKKCPSEATSNKQIISYLHFSLLHSAWENNGKEFAKHQEIAKELQITIYFCKPYHSWECGANENMNGLIRQYIPKGTDFSEITDEFVSWVENKLNNRPRK